MNSPRARIYCLVAFVISTSVTSAFALPERKTLTAYTRNTSYAGRVPLLVFRSMYDTTLFPWLKGEFGLNEGLVNARQGQWGYKVELESAHFLDYFSVLGRLTKLNTRLPTENIESLWMARLAFRYRLGDFQLSASGGVARDFASRTASTIIPTWTGQSEVDPVFAVGASYYAHSLDQTYSVKWASFDVFDAYPASQAFFQLDIDQDFGGFSLFAYGRYRYNGNPGKLYAFYSTIGIVIPLEERESERNGKPRKHPRAPWTPQGPSGSSQPGATHT